MRLSALQPRAVSAIVKAQSAMNRVCGTFILCVLAQTILGQVSPSIPATNEVDLAELAKNKADWPAGVALTEKMTWPVIVIGVHITKTGDEVRVHGSPSGGAAFSEKVTIGLFIRLAYSLRHEESRCPHLAAERVSDLQISAREYRPPSGMGLGERRGYTPGLFHSMGTTGRINRDG
jgi:hypothetical protein